MSKKQSFERIDNMSNNNELSESDITIDYINFIKGIKNNDSIETLGLSRRTLNCLVIIGDITYISELIEMSEKDLLGILYIGNKTVGEIKEKLAKHNLKLKDDKSLQKKKSQV